MFCRYCGRPNPEGTRFCGDCGAVIGESALVPASPSSLSGALHGARLPACAYCGSAAPLSAYFSRPLNIAKVVVAAWFWIIPAVLFYLARRDRLVCGVCGRWRGSVRALESAQAAWVGQLGPMAGDAALVLPPRSEPAELALREAAKKKRSAVFWGVVSTVFVGLAFASGVGALAGAVGCGAWAVFQFARGDKLQKTGTEGKKRHDMLRILQLAKAHGGRLNVTDVAASLAMDLGEAERALDGMVDGTHVEMNVDDQGRVRYVFTEIVAP